MLETARSDADTDPKELKSVIDRKLKIGVEISENDDARRTEKESAFEPLVLLFISQQRRTPRVCNQSIGTHVADQGVGNLFFLLVEGNEIRFGWMPMPNANGNVTAEEWDEMVSYFGATIRRVMS